MNNKKRAIVVVVLASLVMTMFCNFVLSDEIADTALTRIDQKRAELSRQIELTRNDNSLTRVDRLCRLSELHKDRFMLDYDDPRTPLGALLSMSDTPDEQLTRCLFKMVLKRSPACKELAACDKLFARKTRKEAVLDIVWAMCNMEEFIPLID